MTTIVKATSSRPVDVTDTSMADISNNTKVSWLRENIQ